jgi:hypothetical protein
MENDEYKDDEYKDDEYKDDEYKDDEYKDAYYVKNFAMNYPPLEKERTETLRLTQEFNERFFKYTGKTIEITNLSVITDDIKNYRSLSAEQITQIDSFTHEETIRVIKVYNKMYSTLEDIIKG